MSDVLWKDIPGYDGTYQINRFGDVRSWRSRGRGTVAKEPTIIKGYLKDGTNRVVLRGNDGKSHCKSVNALLREVGFLTEKNDKNTVRRPVEMLDCNGNVVEYYYSIQAAAVNNYVTPNAIRYYCTEQNAKPFRGIDGLYTFRFAGPKQKIKGGKWSEF